MNNHQHIAQAKAELAQLELSEKARVFLDKCFEVIGTTPIEYIEVERTYKGAKFTVHFVGGSYREFAAG